MLLPLLINEQPHWQITLPEELWPAFEDFRNFLYLVWDHLGLPEPTSLQIEVAHRLQYGADSYEWSVLSDAERKVLLEAPRSDIIEDFSGNGFAETFCQAFNHFHLQRRSSSDRALY